MAVRRLLEFKKGSMENAMSTRMMRLGDKLLKGTIPQCDVQEKIAELKKYYQKRVPPKLRGTLGFYAEKATRLRLAKRNMRLYKEIDKGKFCLLYTSPSPRD